MKIIVTSLLFIACFFLVSFKTPLKNTNLTIATKLSFDEEEEFVELMDGKIIKGNVTKCNVFKTNSFKAKGSGYVIIDDVKYDYDEVMAVQYKKNRFKKNADGVFTKRYYKSKISVYYTWIDIGGGSTTRNIYYILKGDKGTLLEMTEANLRTMVNNCPPAIAVLDEYDKLTGRAQMNRSVKVFYDCIDTYDKY
jgi:hypothetical protein